MTSHARSKARALLILRSRCLSSKDTANRLRSAARLSSIPLSRAPPLSSERFSAPPWRILPTTARCRHAGPLRRSHHRQQWNTMPFDRVDPARRLCNNPAKASSPSGDLSTAQSRLPASRLAPSSSLRSLPMSAGKLHPRELAPVTPPPAPPRRTPEPQSSHSPPAQPGETIGSRMNPALPAPVSAFRHRSLERGSLAPTLLQTAAATASHDVQHP